MSEIEGEREIASERERERDRASKSDCHYCHRERERQGEQERQREREREGGSKRSVNRVRHRQRNRERHTEHCYSQTRKSRLAQNLDEILSGLPRRIFLSFPRPHSHTNAHIRKNSAGLRD